MVLIGGLKKKLRPMWVRLNARSKRMAAEFVAATRLRQLLSTRLASSARVTSQWKRQASGTLRENYLFRQIERLDGNRNLNDTYLVEERKFGVAPCIAGMVVTKRLEAETDLSVST